MLVYWDSSALIHLLVDQGKQKSALNFFKQNKKLITWWGSYAECVSAISRLERQNALESQDVEKCLDNLKDLRAHWYEITASDNLMEKTIRLLRVHSLRTADAFQLAAALIANEEKSRSGISSGAFITFDTNLTKIARKEGFKIVAF